MRFSTLIKVLQTGDAGLRWSQLGLDPWLEGAASLDQASAAQLSFLEKGNALTAALGSSGVGALLLPDQQDLIDLAGIAAWHRLCGLRRSASSLRGSSRSVESSPPSPGGDSPLGGDR